MKPVTKSILCAILVLCTGLPLAGQQENTDVTVTVAGLIIPRDETGMYVRNPDGQFEIEWTDETKVALEVSTRLLKGLKGSVLRYRVHSSQQVIDFPIPKGPVTGIVNLRGGGRVTSALQVAQDENWIPERGLSLHFAEPLAEQLPGQNDPRFIGTWDPASNPRTLSIKGTKYELSMKKGGQASALLYNLLSVKDCKPFINKATVLGKKKDGVLIADEIHLQPIGDQLAFDDPKLPRYLFIGDSISGNYDRGLREALAGKFNVHHPPTNCGPSAKGAKNIIDWLGAFDQPGRHWDVISFNHGHWDSKNDKVGYQENLEKVIAELKKTEAKLIWVTTCPVPSGYEPAGTLDANGKAPGRTAGVMQKYLNPWAAEVMARHPDITICDQWQYCQDHETDTYQQWWTGKNVHFKGAAADALGEFLAEHVLKVTPDRSSR